MDYIHNNTVAFDRLNTLTPGATQFHLHDSCEMYLLLDGDLNFYVHHSCYRIRSGALMLLNELEIHKAMNLTDRPHKRIYIHTPAAFFTHYRTPDTPLDTCFHSRPLGERNLLLLTQEQAAWFTAQYAQMEQALHNRQFGRSLLIDTYLIQLLIYVNDLFGQSGERIPAPYPEEVHGILSYLDLHMLEPVTLEDLERQLSLSRSHICHTFKKATGTTVMQYLLYKRIALAKYLLNQGKNVTEACYQAGFCDYTGFITRFRLVTGITPKQYQQRQRNNHHLDVSEEGGLYDT